MGDEQDIAAVMQAAEGAENRRRELASQTPGLGVLMPLGQPPGGPGVGISDVPLPVVGEGYEVQAGIAAAVHKSYGPDRPAYAHPLIGGIGYADGTHQPAVRHVHDLGADGLLIERRADGSNDTAVQVISP
jgi:hypothetical protein